MASESSKDRSPALSDELAEIHARIPHRAPFLLVDRIVELDSSSIRTEWFVSPDADFFRGHYPGQPVLPGVLATEFVIQSGALLVGDPDAEWMNDGSVPVLARVQDARFRRIVRPGTLLTAEVRLDERLGSAFLLRGKVRDASGATTLTVRFTVTVSPGEA